ncbi:isopeptide-forming domain-containing fimbrial protein [Streptococcus ruminantium]|uniref:isopeptide-forming domain-containing fimbrial protein n=3 Tax=Streptococcus ruminantium TaxID=1917441 RepID=UPI001D1447E8|nr:isopeptide-forming domain-containing fimbrial protein [Streptococcus ruminantium]
MLISQLGMLLGTIPNIKAVDLGATTTDGVTTTVSQQGCAIKIETKQEVNWGLPRQPVDLVILQDASGSFTNTIRNVKDALIDLTTPVAVEKYDEKNPRLVFTNDPKTTDRVMVATYGDADAYRLFDSTDYYNVATSDSNFTDLGRTVPQNGYRYTSTGEQLLSSKEQIDNFINNFTVGGLTPTVPAIDQVLAQYNAAKLQGGGMANNRKTVFLLITDGVANVHDVNGTKYMDLSVYRMQHVVSLLRSGRIDYEALYNYAAYYGYEYLGEFGQNYVERAKELKEAGNRIKQAIGEDGTVVVGFWEDRSQFVASGAYWDTYLNGDVFTQAGVNTGDNRSVREVFEEALKSVNSPDREINGENVSFYVNEQNDIHAFSQKILKAVTAALTKEDIEGDFTVTDGYKVNSVTINGKKVVSKVTDENKEIKGSIKQDGNNVKISVPDSIFKPGKNSFEYDLSRTAAEDAVAEEDETDPSDDYQPATKTETVGQLVGQFKVGDYESGVIGSKDPTTVQVTDLKYCYPSATKDVKDTDISNDLGTVDDPIIKNKKSYAANLTTDSELFTYKVLYRMNNAPLEFKKNAMLVDRLDYRVEYKNGYVTDVNGNRLDNFTVQTKDVVDEVTGQMQTVVYAAIPEDPGVNTEYVKEGQYGNHKFKRYYLVIEAKLKDAYSFGKNPDEYKKILQENDGLGLMNQANIIWNGSGEPVDPTAQTRRSNTVYVLPPVQTDIKKDVQSVDGTGEGYVKNQDQLYLGTRSQEYYYNVESAWPGLADSYTLTDTLVPELEFVTTYGNKGAKITVNGNEVKALTDKLTFDGNTVTLKLTKADFTARAISRQITTANRGNNGPAVIKLTIKAKIKDKADLTKYVVNGQIKVPNKATVELNGKPQTSNTVYVTPDEPAPSKKINSTLDVLHTTKSSEAFEFNIQTKLPRDIKSYKSYKITDKLDSRLELTNSPAPYVKEPYAQHFDVTHDAATNTVTATAKATSLSTLTGGEMVELVIPAKIKDGTSVEEIPNTSKIVYETPTSGGEKETPPTPPVVVTPPPLIEKQVNAKQHADLTKRDEVFEYTIKSSVPKGAETFEITDELDEVLEFAGNQGDVVVKIADTAVTDKVEVTRSERNLGIKFTKEQLTADAGKAIVITFKAKIRGDVNLSVDKYTQDGTIKVPNKAKYTLNNNPKESNTVTVTPPTPTPPTVEKKVNDKVHETLGQRNQTFDYSIATQVPTDAKSFVITDELKEVLEFAGNDGKGEVVVKIGDAIVTNTTDVKTENQTLTVSLTADQLAKLQGQKVLVTFKAKIRANVNLTGYLVEGSDTIKVPNTASISVDNKPKVDSQPVTVTPPTPTPPTVEKKVNNKEHEALGQRDQMFEYSIETQVPTDAKSFVITDELKEVLEFAGNDGKGNVTVKIDEADVTKDTKVTVENQILTVSLTADQLAKLQGQKVLVTFKAKIRANVNLIAYLEKASNTIKVPNTASIRVDNNPKVDSRPVTVTPPTPDTPTIVKKVNNKDHEDLTKRDEEFEYTIQTQVPTDAKSFVITDELKEVLEFVGKDGKNGVTVKIGETDVTNNTTVKIENRTLTVSLTDDQLAKYQGQKVLVTFKAKIVANADLTAYTANGTTKVPNTANFVINNDFTTKKETEPVTVTPPGETPTPKKTVNDKQAEKLSNLDEVFTYKVTAEVPKNTAGFTKFELSDDLEDILTITETGVTVGDATLDKGMTVTSPKDANADSGKVTAALPTNEISKYAGKTVVLTIKARIKEGVQSFELAKYITADNQEGSIPNKATLTVGDKPDQKKDSNNVPVTPPSEDPTVTKKINDKLEHLDTETATNYTYNIKTKLPADITTYKKFVISDELDAELAVQGKPVISGPAAQFFDVKVEGQLVTATMKNFVTAQELAGKEVELVIVSQIRKGVTTQNIPNIARITYQNRTHAAGTPDSKKDTPPVTVTPPGETPTVEKKINKDLTEATVLPESNYTYNITSLLPVDITRYKAYAIVDELDENLAIQGTPVMAKIDGVDMTQFFDVKVAGQKVTATMKNFENAKDLAGKKVELVITAQVKSTSKAPKIDNTAKVTYQNKSHVDGTPDSETPPTPPVTVTPPPVTKKINETLDHLDTATKTNYNYNIKTVLPSDIASYKTFVINDDLDKDLEVQGTPIIKGDAAKFFKVTVDGQKVRATITDFNAAKAYAGKEVELVIVSQIREGVTRQAIPNQTTITYTNKVKVGGEPGDTTTTPPTPPVTVTPPGEDPTVEKKINHTLDHLDVDTEKDYTYNITTTLPVDITSYKKFAIVDVLDKDLAVQGTPTITGEAAKFFDVKVDGQTVTAAMKDFKNAKDLAGKKVELVIVSQIREGVTRQAIPNTAKVTYQNKSHVDGTPDSETPPTPPVTVTPPGEDPTVEKKINHTLDHLDVDTEKDYTYNITTTLPVDITSYKKFAIVDVLDKDLAVQGTPTITGEAAKFFDVKVDGQTVTATMKDFKNAKDLAGKKVELVIVSQVREGVTRQAIPNTAKVEFTNKAGQVGEKETKPVTVTPPTPNTPPIEKKVNGAESADLASRQEVFTYTIDTIVPTGAFAFEVSDTLKDVLTFEGAVTATLSGKSIAQSQISIDGQTVTVKLTKQQVREQAGKPLHIEFSAKVKDGVDLTPYMTNGKTSIPNTANYIVNNDPATKKDSNTVPVYPPTPNEPDIDKKINRDLTHLNVEVNKSYMYNVTANLPQDIATYREFVITDTLESVLAINGDVVAYVDGYATDAVKVTVEGNRVVATVVDFAKLAGFKQIQLYIPAYIKSDADLTAYVTNNVASIPNTASLEFTDSNGVKKRKDTTPVTVTPPTPDTPPTPPVNPPQPGTPVKTVSRVEGLEQTNYLALLQATESFRFDIKSVVPMDEAEDRRLNLTSITITDQLDPLFTVDKAKVAVKLTNAPTSNANYIDEDVEKAQAELDAEKAKLEEIKKSSQTEASAAALSEAQKVVARLETELAEAQAKLTELKTSATSATTESSSSTEVSAANPVDVIATDHSSEIAAQEVVIAELQAKLEAVKQRVQAAQEVLAKAKTPSEVKVEADNQEKVVAAKQKVLDEAKEKQAKVQERVEQFAKVNDKGELTAEAIAALGGTIKVDGQFVTVDFTDEYTMEALKGYTVNVIIYSSITDVNALTIDHFTKGIDNTATVQFNHDPSDNLTKKTNKVTVVPPKNETPPPPATPDKPKGDLPTPPTPPTEPTPPPSSGPILPKTGTNENGVYAIVGIILGALTFVLRKRKDNDSL